MTTTRARKRTQSRTPLRPLPSADPATASGCVIIYSRTLQPTETAWYREVLRTLPG